MRFMLGYCCNYQLFGFYYSFIATRNISLSLTDQNSTVTAKKGTKKIANSLHGLEKGFLSLTEIPGKKRESSGYLLISEKHSTSSATQKCTVKYRRTMGTKYTRLVILKLLVNPSISSQKVMIWNL